MLSFAPAISCIQLHPAMDAANLAHVAGPGESQAKDVAAAARCLVASMELRQLSSQASQPRLASRGLRGMWGRVEARVDNPHSSGSSAECFV